MPVTKILFIEFATLVRPPQRVDVGQISVATEVELKKLGRPIAIYEVKQSLPGRQPVRRIEFFPQRSRIISEVGLAGILVAGVKQPWRFRWCHPRKIYPDARVVAGSIQ
ncbi:hypothetical protein [Mesorhizobium sp. M1322]|uniref:hypothetical protein n=1 Tax=Mesorhizobium sp. M1322 TaxID=2957081 RepID=UPI00333D3E92